MKLHFWCAKAIRTKRENLTDEYFTSENFLIYDIRPHAFVHVTKKENVFRQSRKERIENKSTHKNSAFKQHRPTLFLVFSLLLTHADTSPTKKTWKGMAGY